MFSSGFGVIVRIRLQTESEAKDASIHDPAGQEVNQSSVMERGTSEIMFSETITFFNSSFPVERSNKPILIHLSYNAFIVQIHNII